MGTFYMSIVFMLHRGRIVFNMWVVMTMFMNEWFQGDVPVCTYTQRKLARSIARDEYVNEQNNEY